MNYLRVWVCRAVVILFDPKLKTLGERGIECMFVGYAKHSKSFRFYVIKPNESVLINFIIKSMDAIFDENIFSLVARPSQRSLINGTEDIGGSVVLEQVTKEVVTQQPKPELRKGKSNKTPKNFRPEFQLYLIEGTRDKAINDEMDCITGNNTWLLADLPPGCKPLSFKWIFKRKLKVDGNIEKFTARLVIQGFRQKSWIDYFDAYALVARISTIRLLIALASIHSLIIYKMDVKTPFLNGKWTRSKGVIICLYVDDMLIFGTNQVQVDLTKELLPSRFSIKDIGEADVILEAINDEMDCITGNKTWLLADLPPGYKPLSFKWIFKRKLKVDGNIEKFTARLVIQGFRQKSWIDYFDAYALVARISTIRLLIALASIHIPRPSQRSLINGTEDIGGSVVLEQVTKEVVSQQPKPELRKGKSNKTPKNFRPEFQLYLIEGTRDKVSDQHAYCFNVEDDLKE
nr:zinc finger, CCHC-type [Tanacetum cinerariifolium]